MSGQRHFEDQSTSLAYHQYRFQYENLGVVKWIVSYLYETLQKEPNTLAVDVGCGTGFMTRVLAPHFSKVVGVDCSPSQIKVAEDNREHDNVTYREGMAEDLGFLQPGSVDLVTVAEALHWFESDRFYTEVDRVLKPGGCVALVAYGSARSQDVLGTLSANTGHEKIDERCKLFFEKIIVDHVYPNLRQSAEKLTKAGLPSPGYPETNYFTEKCEMEGNVDMFVGYLKSLGTLFTGSAGSSETLIDSYGKGLLEILGEVSASPGSVDLKLTSTIHCFIHRKSIHNV